MIDPADYITDNSLKVLVKPGKKNNYVLGYDYEKKVLVVEIKAPAQDNKANKELVKFLSKLLKKRVKIKSGHTSKIKTLLVH